MKAIQPGQFSLFDETVPLRRVDQADLLPKTARELVDAIGLEATIDLVKMFGGDELTMPGLVDGESRTWELLVECIGREAAARLVERFRGTTVYVPMCRAALRAERNREIIASYDGGEPFDSIRRRHRLSRSYLFRLLKKSV